MNGSASERLSWQELRMMWIFSWISAIILAFSTIGCSAGRPSADGAGHAADDSTGADVIAIVGADVIPMTSPGKIFHDQTVLVHEGNISAAGPRSEVVVPVGALEIDGRGQFLIPALADMHVHLEHFDDPDLLALFPRYGVTLVRNMDGRPAILEWRDAVREGRLMGPEIVTAGPILDGDPPLLPDNRVIAGADEAREAVREQAAAGYDFIKTYSNLSADAWRAAVDTAKEEGLRVAGHAPRDVELTELLDSQWSLEHLADYGEIVEKDDSPYRNRWHWSKLLVGMPIDASKLEHLAQHVASSDMWVVPTLVQSSRAMADAATLEEWLNHPEMDLIPEAGVAFWKERLQSSASRMDEEDWKLVDAGRSNRQAIVSELYEAGARIAVGTDTPNPFVIPGASLHEEMELLVEAGMNNEDVLAAATTGAATMLGKANWGTIEEGSEADMILLRDNPLADIRATRSIVGVMVNGQWKPVVSNFEMTGRVFHHRLGEALAHGSAQP